MTQNNINNMVMVTEMGAHTHAFNGGADGAGVAGSFNIAYNLEQCLLDMFPELDIAFTLIDGKWYIEARRKDRPHTAHARIPLKLDEHVEAMLRLIA